MTDPTPTNPPERITDWASWSADKARALHGDAVTPLTDDEPSQPYIYVEGKYTPCTLDEMIQQFNDRIGPSLGVSSDIKPWLGDLIYLLLEDRDVLQNIIETALDCFKEINDPADACNAVIAILDKAQANAASGNESDAMTPRRASAPTRGETR